MKDTAKIFILSVLILTLTACGVDKNSRNPGNNNSVNKVIGKQIEKSGEEKNDAGSEKETSPKRVSLDAPQETTAQSDGSVDYDLTKMNSDMVYFHIIDRTNPSFF